MRKKKVNPALLVAVLVAAVAAAFLIVQPALEAQPAAAPTPTPQVSVSDGDGLTSVQRFIVLPDDGIESLTDLIGSARKRVFMKMYMLTDQRIVDALAQAQKNGADVRAMLEDHPFGAANSGQQAIDMLKAAGITTKVSNPTFRLTHEKSFTIDNVAVILTANMTKSAFSRNREFGVVDAEPGDVDEIVAAFNADLGPRRIRAQPPQPGVEPRQLARAHQSGD